jgi:hypothetical protein
VEREPHDCSACPRRSGVYPSSKYCCPRGSGVYPSSKYSYPRPSGARPRPSGARPRRSGCCPRLSGVYPSHPGACPRRSGIYPSSKYCCPRSSGVHPSRKYSCARARSASSGTAARTTSPCTRSGRSGGWLPVRLNLAKASFHWERRRPAGMSGGIGGTPAIVASPARRPGLQPNFLRMPARCRRCSEIAALRHFIDLRVPRSGMRNSQGKPAAPSRVWTTADHHFDLASVHSEGPTSIQRNTSTSPPT